MAVALLRQIQFQGIRQESAQYWTSGESVGDLTWTDTPGGGE